MYNIISRASMPSEIYKPVDSKGASIDMKMDRVTYTLQSSSQVNTHSKCCCICNEQAYDSAKNH